MTIEKLRVTKDPNEIRAFFQEYIQKKCPVLLWQNIEEKGVTKSKRIIFNGFFSLLNNEKNIIILNYETNEDSQLDFDQSSTLYIKGEAQSILFKVEISHHVDIKIILQIPTEVRVCEKREKARINFGYDFEGKVEFFNYRAYRSKRKHSSAKLVDVSQGGMAMLMFTGKAHSWSNGDTFHVISINDFEFQNQLSATIRYIRTVKITRNNQSISAYRFGIKFDRELSSKELSSILNKTLSQGSQDQEKAG